MAGELLVNMKFADAAGPTPGFAVIVNEPVAPPATKLPVNVPPVSEHDCEATGRPLKLQVIAVGSKPEPDTCTVVPT